MRGADQKGLIREAARAAGVLDFMDACRDRFGARLVYFKAGDLELGSQDYKEGAVPYVRIQTAAERKAEWKAIKEKSRRGAAARSAAKSPAVQRVRA